LSQHFPPGQAAGALRWQKLAAFAADSGWGMDVLTLAPADLPEPGDESLLADLPRGVRVYGIPRPSFPLKRIETALVALKKGLPRRSARQVPPPGAASAAPAQSAFAPSELGRCPRTREEWGRAYSATKAYALDGAWSRAAAVGAEKLFDADRHRLVVSCGPPHMAHLAGRRISARCGLPLVVDMRDPWRLVEMLPPGLASPAWRLLSQRHEPRVVDQAGLVVMNTPLARDAMRRTYPQKADRIISVLNGWDEDPIPEASRERGFLVAFTGSMYLDRDPRPFLRAAGRVARELQLSPDEFAIEFVGHVETYGDVSTARLAAAEGLERHFRARSQVPRRQAMELQARATLLLNLPQSLHMAIPSKVYDYMRFPAWLLSLSDPDSATAWLLREAGADVVAPSDVDAIARALKERVLQYRRGERPRPLTDPRFSRRAQAQRLFQAIEQIV
jgi:hypothetical protein